MRRWTVVALAALTMATAGVAAGAPLPVDAAPAATSVRSPGMTVTPLFSGWVGLPTRVWVTVPSSTWLVSAQLRQRSGWRTVSTSRADARGSAIVSWEPSGAGRTDYRVVARSTVGASNLYSGPRWLTVREPAVSAVPTSTPSDPVEGVVSAGGQAQWISCRGSGGPTVVLVAGITGWSKDWARQVGPLAAGGRVCVYDRPGLGQSLPRTGPATIDSLDHARELRALLSAAGERGPYILVGHSYGGLIVRSFLNAYPKLVAGLALLEAVPPDMARYYPGYSHTFGEGGAVIDLDASAPTTGFLAPLKGLPLVVLSADHPVAWAPSYVVGIWNEQQDLAAAASENSLRLTAVNAGHQLQEDVPQLVVRVIEVLRDSVRRHVMLPGCDGGWSELRAECSVR